eukprot:TRINITY_DN15619_c0_g1_i1.p1 TRINITY_DN15619_c0_g1~~TRINITY_DN15619_c0_g1_i1.p1  ORF type:complete len:309 (+),score=78.82 TRINITY_DN15619_c0_g1_i1:54-980(+)
MSTGQDEEQEHKQEDTQSDTDDLLVHSGADNIPKDAVWKKPGRHQTKRKWNEALNATARRDKEYIYGNYDKYYGYRSIVEDNRVKAIKRVKAELKGKAWLDIGCNNGQLTTVLATAMEARTILGIDIDGRLIERARKMMKKTEIPSSSYFPLSCFAGFGGLPVPSPPTITFETANIVNNRHNIPLPQSGTFDVVLCLSCSKWIHLNYGDEGLRAAFLRIYDLLSSGGLFVFEPQPWKSYLKTGAKIKDKVVLGNRYKLKMRPDSFDAHLKNLGFEMVRKLLPEPLLPEGKGDGTTGFKERELLMYRKK